MAHVASVCHVAGRLVVVTYEALVHEKPHSIKALLLDLGLAHDDELVERLSGLVFDGNRRRYDEALG